MGMRGREPRGAVVGGAGEVREQRAKITGEPRDHPSSNDEQSTTTTRPKEWRVKGERERDGCEARR